MMHKIPFRELAFFGLLFFSTSSSLFAQAIWINKSGKIDFRSDAPLEIIQASSNALKGALNTEDQTFAFSIQMATFQGFNSPLQRVHFNENYMESARYPEATFSGRIIEQIDLSQPGEYLIRAKGLLTIHGVPVERIIKCKVIIQGQGCRYSASFSVPLVDHAITIPKVVNQKIAEEIQVRVEGELMMKSK